MNTKAERLARLVGKLAGLAAVLTLVVITVSALLRLAQAGLGCEPWPQCYGAARAVPWLDAVRAMHRVSALAVGLIVLMTFVLAASGGRAAARLAILAGAALAVVVFLTWVGIITPGSRLPAIALANLLGGMTLFALLWGLFHAAGSAGKTVPWRADAIALIAIPLLFTQIGLGALAHATFSSASCPTLAGCAVSEWLPLLAAPAFDPFQPVAVVDGHSMPRAGAGAVQMTHRALALGVAAWLAWVAWRAWQVSAARASALALAGLLILQIGTGTLLVMLQMPLATAAAHNVAASLLLAALLRVVLRLRAAP